MDNMNNINKIQQQEKEKADDQVVHIKDAATSDGQLSEAFSIGYKDFDDAMLGGVREGDLIIITGKTGQGKCHGKGTQILMFNGSLKKVEDIKVGDLIMGDDSTPRKILSLAQGKEEMYRVSHKKDKTESYTVNESHILSLWNAGSSYGGHQVVDISVKDYLNKSDGYKFYHKGYKAVVNFKKQKVSIDPYFIGLWLGDGCTDDVGITTMDNGIKKYLYNYAKELNLKVTVINHKNNKSNTYRLVREKKFKSFRKYFNGKYIYENKRIKGYGNIKSLKGCLKKLNLIGNKHIPEIYKVNSRKNRLKLLAGLIDSDGYKNDNCYEITIKLENLAKDIVYLCRSLGLWSNYTLKYNKKYNKNYYRIKISGELSNIPILLKRKKCHKRKQIKNVLHYGIKIEKLGVDNYYGFEIDGNHRYLLGDFTVTHNTTLFQNICANLSKQYLPSTIFSYEVIVDNLYAKFKDMGMKNTKDGLFVYVPKRNTTGNLKWVKEKIKEGLDKYSAKFVFIDHLDNLSPTNLKNGDQLTTTIRNICQELKDVAIELKVVIFLVSHVRKISPSSEITLEDLADSRSVSQIADFVISVKRITEVKMINGERAEVEENRSTMWMLKNRLTGQKPRINYILEDNIIKLI